jgi:Flp pilus assembly protein TadG
MQLWLKIRETLQEFLAARSGNVAITFAIATLPIIGGSAQRSTIATPTQ